MAICPRFLGMIIQKNRWSLSELRGRRESELISCHYHATTFHVHAAFAAFTIETLVVGCHYHT